MDYLIPNSLLTYFLVDSRFPSSILTCLSLRHVIPAIAPDVNLEVKSEHIFEGSLSAVSKPNLRSTLVGIRLFFALQFCLIFSSFTHLRTSAPPLPGLGCAFFYSTNSSNLYLCAVVAASPSSLAAFPSSLTASHTQT